MLLSAAATWPLSSALYLQLSDVDVDLCINAWPAWRRPGTCNASINGIGPTIRLMMLFLRVSMVTSSSGSAVVCRFSSPVIALLIINYSYAVPVLCFCWSVSASRFTYVRRSCGRRARQQAVTTCGLAVVDPCPRSFTADGDVMSYRTTAMPLGLLRAKTVKFSFGWFFVACFGSRVVKITMRFL